MKKLYIIGGTMGVGKTTTCQLLKNELADCVFLDGDWCWDMHPFKISVETKKMVMNNICYILNNFLSCSTYQNVIFCWVMHEQEIIDEILSRVDTANYKVFCISLVCDAESLKKRLQKDVTSGIRADDVITRSIARLPLYDKLNTIKINVSNITAAQTAAKIAHL
ncbi:AAA family ATPase [Pectinatus frisingensis]|uniref:AAA family ATPase n=1 Tax=Pectinatus frisingensis TaxID=865 RepID=UPI0018C7D8B2|nr:AAA family ATPase [Pectinatus frisingensis]